MSTRLVILGLLRERPLYGYEIKQIIEEHMGDWTSIAFGSIYFALGKLAEEGFIEKTGTQQEGNRPSRSIYEITALGREEFLRLLHQVWNEMERHYFGFDIGLFFMRALSLDEISGYLRKRVAILEEVVAHLAAHKVNQLAQDEVPPQAAAIFEHSETHSKAELAWTKDLLTKVERGEYG